MTRNIPAEANPRNVQHYFEVAAATYATKLRWARDGRVSITRLTVLSKDPDPQIRAAVARNPKTPPNILTQLAKDENNTVVAAVAENPKTPYTILDAIADSHTEKSVLQKIALNPNITEETAWKLTVDEHPHVRYTLARNKFVPQVVLRTLEEDLIPYVRRAAAETLYRATH